MNDYGPLPEPDAHAALGVLVNRALFADGCQRLQEWSMIGPVQRAALESFAERLLAAARERCAKLCDEHDPSHDVSFCDTAEQIAAAIRAA